MEFSIPDLIHKKRDGGELTKEEMKYFIASVASGQVQDSQIGAMLMAMFLKNLSDREAISLTECMKNNGDTFSWPPEWKGIVVDKHSTGGVGDKISLILAPALAACGAKVPMISGRGLNFTGGTLDKLEAIPGYNIYLSVEDITRALRDVGCCIVGQTERLCPADKKLYAIRDVTATVDNVGLITGSIVSKKAAENVDVLVLDVKTGKGAFMERREQARELSQSMVNVGTGLGIHTTAVITDMSFPLGRGIGNALEVAEAVSCLHGNGPSDIMELVTTLGGHVLANTPLVKSFEEGKRLVEEKVKDKSALEKFKAMIKIQGVAADKADQLCTAGVDVYSVLPKAAHVTEIKSDKNGYVAGVDSLACADVVRRLGGGRSVAGQQIDYSVGLELLVQQGGKIQKGDCWVRVHHSSSPLDAPLFDSLRDALTISDVTPTRRSRVLEVVTPPSLIIQDNVKVGY